MFKNVSNVLNIFKLKELRYVLDMLNNLAESFQVHRSLSISIFLNVNHPCFILDYSYFCFAFLTVTTYYLKFQFSTLHGKR